MRDLYNACPVKQIEPRGKHHCGWKTISEKQVQEVKNKFKEWKASSRSEKQVQEVKNKFKKWKPSSNHYGELFFYILFFLFIYSYM